MPYAHPAGIVIVSPGGRITRYFSGVAFPSEMLRTSVIQAAREEIAPPQGLRWMRCFHDAVANGARTGTALALVRIVGALAALGLAATALVLRRRAPGDRS